MGHFFLSVLPVNCTKQTFEYYSLTEQYLILEYLVPFEKMKDDTPYSKMDPILTFSCLYSNYSSPCCLILKEQTSKEYFTLNEATRANCTVF